MLMLPIRQHRRHWTSSSQWVFLNETLCFWGDKRQKVSQLAPISILASMFLGRVQLKNVFILAENFHWHDMALSEHGFSRAKTFHH